MANHAIVKIKDRFEAALISQFLFNHVDISKVIKFEQRNI